MTVFNRNQIDIMDQPMILGESTGIARYETVKHKMFEGLTEKALSFFWRPEEVSLMTDKAQYDKLQEHEKGIFTDNLKYQTLLDSIQGRAPALAFAPLISDVGFETWVQTWTFSETIHSRSYTHIMRNVYEDPAAEFDTIVLNESIMKRAETISVYYDALIDATHEYEEQKRYCERCEKTVEETGDSSFVLIGVYNNLEKAKLAVMKAYYLCMHVVNALEAIRFYVSFMCTFNFFENMGVMEGNAKIMKLIARDEQLHLKGTQYILKQIQNGGEGEEFKRIAEECREEANAIFLDVNKQEKEWVDYLFRNGTVPGLSHESLKTYVDYMTNIRMQSAGLDSPFKHVTRNPFPWSRKYLNSDNVQMAPQEVEVDSYLISQIDDDVDTTVLNTFEQYLN
ncbi:ribonucleotide reductase class Ia beta subunit [Morganella phage vB_MmoM_MP1]|uniref:ribonucleoside-diphosphate reductase n=1 Tax=Morganella phage vB_MmoM_MP1 TaxID=1852628 RepID=A0A192YA82_9CAUD|nr:ribonucleotide reductase class Ia beta subunit [Morganella phage vB_MmoM_MP1]ANM46423.1 ribonucleotide reductase of class Ia (aerobic), beta subunit [Morganella phage vB_MmoM_MP1]